MSILYAAYGSNMNLRQMAHRCPNAKRIGVGVINNYELVFARNGYAHITGKKGSSVPVVLWELTAVCEAALDHYEGYPIFYKKQLVKVKTKKEILEAMVYVMAEPYCDVRMRPSYSYLERIKEGYRDNLINQDIIIE